MKRTNLTTSSRSFREDTLPFKLYQKAKKFGVWNPRDINFSQDIEDWKSFTSIERSFITDNFAFPGRRRSRDIGFTSAYYDYSKGR